MKVYNVPNFTSNNYRDNRNSQPIAYNNLTNLETPNLEFEPKDCTLNLKLIENINNDIFLPENYFTYAKIKDNLIHSKIYENDYDDIHKPILFKSFQIILEYLQNKENKIKKINKELENQADIVLKNTEKLEKILTKNKNKIAKNSEIKKEKMNLLSKFNKDLVLLKDKKINYEIKIKEKQKEIIQNIKNEESKKYPCPVCHEKYFPNISTLNFHIQRRHPKKEDTKPKVDYTEKYVEKIENLKKYIEDLVKNPKNSEKKSEYETKFEEFQKENNDKMSNIENYNKNILEEIKEITKKNININKDYYDNLLILAGIKEDEKDIKSDDIILECPTKEELKSLIKSLEKLKYTISKQNKKNLDKLQNEINDFKKPNKQIFEDIKEENEEYEEEDIKDIKQKKEECENNDNKENNNENKENNNDNKIDNNNDNKENNNDNKISEKNESKENENKEESEKNEKNEIQDIEPIKYDFKITRNKKQKNEENDDFINKLLKEYNINIYPEKKELEGEKSDDDTIFRQLSISQEINVDNKHNNLIIINNQFQKYNGRERKDIPINKKSRITGVFEKFE